MDMDRPEDFRFDAAIGRVLRVNPDTWEVDLEAEDGGIVQRALVLGPRLPEPSTETRPQWCLFAYAASTQARAVCWPAESRLPGIRAERRDFVYYDEVLNYRITINRAGEFEVRNTKGGRLLQVRIQESTGMIRSDTPTTHSVLDDDNQKARVHADGDIEADAGQNIKATAGTNIEATAGGNIEAEAGGDITAEAGGNIEAEAAGNASIEAGGMINLTAGLATISMGGPLGHVRINEPVAP